jgi:hypothetical protein
MGKTETSSLKGIKKRQEGNRRRFRHVLEGGAIRRMDVLRKSKSVRFDLRIWDII